MNVSFAGSCVKFGVYEVFVKRGVGWSGDYSGLMSSECSTFIGVSGRIGGGIELRLAWQVGT